MSEVNYSKKQINPLIEKYKINTETNMVFKSIITMFEDQTNYQIWAIKSVFENVIKIENLQRIKVWAENNHTEIKNLVKGNIILYKTVQDFKMLEDEMNGLNMMKFVKDSINKFNTRQRKMMTNNILGGITDGLDALNNPMFKEWFNILRQMSTLVRHRQEKLVSTSSAIDDFNFLKSHIKSALAETYEWNKEDMLGFMARNASDCSVVFDENNVVVIQVPSFKSAKLMCGNGRTGWCLTREERYFNQYVKEPKDASQYFLFDFNKPENNELAHIGFTVRLGSGISNAHSTKNSNLCGEGINVNGRRVNIHTALADAKVPNSVFIHLKPLRYYKWDVETFLKYLEQNKRDLAISVAENNRFIVRALTNDGLAKLIDHTLLDYRAFNVSNDTKTYALIDFNLTKDSDKSVVVLHYTKDKYKFDTLSNMKDAYNVNMVKSKYLESIGITTDMYLNREAIDPTILLHKLIDEGSEKEAIDLICKEGDAFDVNYEFNNNSPIFKAISSKMYNLFDVIVKHKKFNAETADGFGEPLLLSLMYSLTPSEDNRENEAINKMINSILSSKDFDFNAQNINLDTAVTVACEKPHMYWIAERLIADPNININIINDFNCGALGNAIRRKNTKVLKLLGTRPDLVIREEDKELAKQNGYNLDEFINPQPFATHTVQTVINDENETSDSDALIKLFANALRYRK